jgi:hypothetical protein
LASSDSVSLPYVILWSWQPSLIVVSGTVLSASGEELPFASIVVLIVAFDLSLNAAVHYLNRLRLEDRPGEDSATSLGPCLL